MDEVVVFHLVELGNRSQVVTLSTQYGPSYFWESFPLLVGWDILVHHSTGSLALRNFPYTHIL